MSFDLLVQDKGRTIMTVLDIKSKDALKNWLLRLGGSSTEFTQFFTAKSIELGSRTILLLEGGSLTQQGGRKRGKK